VGMIWTKGENGEKCDDDLEKTRQAHMRCNAGLHDFHGRFTCAREAHVRKCERKW